MIEIYVCMGSACYVKGSAKIVEVLKNEIQEKKLSAIVKLKGSFCLGPCIEGVVVKIGNKIFKHLNPENIKRRFESEILTYILEKNNTKKGDE